jgi:hypothetical protein
MAYYPSWIIRILLDKKEYALMASGVTGRIANIEKIPLKEKKTHELVGETFRELKEPGAWLKYSREIAREIFNAITRPESWGSAGNALLHNRSLQIAIVLVAAAYVIWFWL